MTAAKREPSGNNPKWFGYALQALVVLATHRNAVCPSGEMAEHIESQATLLRRVMAQLAKHELVEAKEGRDGGYRLAKAAERITLADVYRAVQAGEPLSLGLVESTSEGMFGQEMQLAFAEIVDDVEHRIVEALEQRTIADLIRRVDVDGTGIPGCPKNCD